MPHDQYIDFPFTAQSGEDISGPITIAFEAALVLANIFPIIVVFKIRRKRQRIAADELIGALSITDILSVVVPAPLGWISYFGHQWYGGRWTCQFYQVALVWFQLTSMCLVTFMCFDRWMSLRDAMSYKLTLGGHWRVRVSVLMVYVFTLVVSCLPLLGLAPDPLSSSGKLCQSWIVSEPTYAVEHVFHFVFLTIGYSTLLTAIFVNVTVIASLWRFQRKFGSKSAERMSSAALQIDRKSVVETTVMILAVTLVFYLAWLPALVMITLRQLEVAVPSEAVLYALLSTTLTGLLNPIIYGVFSRTYRKGYGKIVVGLTKCLFGCPITHEDILTDISSQARRMRSAGSTSNSLAGLLSHRSPEPAELGARNHDSAAFGCAKDNLCFSVTHESRASLLGRHDSDSAQRDATSSSTRSNYRARENSNSEAAISLQERTYIDEVLHKLENSANKDNTNLYGSNLSLISEESDCYRDDISEDSYEVVTSHRSKPFPRVVQESMI